MGAVVLAGTVMAGCTGGGGAGGAVGSPGPSSAGTAAGAAPLLTEARAKEVFDRYVLENAAADAKGDTEALARVEGGRLLEESRAVARLDRAKGTKATPVRYVRPVFLIPAVAEGAPAPRGFAVLSKREGAEKDRSSVLHYFTRGGGGGDGDGAGGAGDWKAVVATWVVTVPPPATPSASPTASPKEGVIRVRPKVLPEPARGAAGNAELSPTATADTAVCGRYADYLSFIAPAGKPDSPYFEPGDFTGTMVDHFNGWAAEKLQRSFSYRPVGEELPVFRLKDGGSLVTCTLEGTYRNRGVTSANWALLDADSDSEALLGGGRRKWAGIEEVWSATAVVEVPQGGGPATVLSTDAYDATKLSVKGVEWK
ncbi:hypothetical protein ACFYYB_09210 [Streptomyces sp. NPDC002886]|uniref:hypothetical protein n=1 Tax=Streptomyces sp. NPDC002886 TaxID=3364667 RepID=UPI0036AC0671